MKTVTIEDLKQTGKLKEIKIPIPKKEPRKRSVFTFLDEQEELNAE